MQTLGVYIQVPFCASKCSYCNFSSRVARAVALLDAYSSALEGEIEKLPAIYASQGISDHLFDFPVTSVYMGGGTPSLLGRQRLEILVKLLRARFRAAAECEFTIEVTPGSGDEDFLRGARSLGANRLSIGAQSFDDRVLRAVGRLHSAAATTDLVREARTAGFQNINLDLIAGLPHETEESWLHGLRSTLDLRPEHVSIYLFEIDEKSRLGGEVIRHGIRYHADAVPGEDFVVEAYETARRMLTHAGYVQYEISNIALPGHDSRHNRKYWQLEPYVGLGAGAHSFDGEHRWANESSPEAYMQRVAGGESPVAEMRVLSPDEQLEEFFYLGLRQREGVDQESARRRWGDHQLRRWKPRITSLVREGWLERCGERIRLTDHALLVSNEVFQNFLNG